MRVLIGAWPAYGHLLPMVPLIRAGAAGRARGAGDSRGRPGAGGRPARVVAHRSGPTVAESYARMPGEAVISALPPEEQPLFAAKHLFGAGAVDRARDPLELMEAWRPDLVVPFAAADHRPAVQHRRAAPDQRRARPAAGRHHRGRGRHRGRPLLTEPSFTAAARRLQAEIGQLPPATAVLAVLLPAAG